MRHELVMPHGRTDAQPLRHNYAMPPGAAISRRTIGTSGTAQIEDSVVAHDQPPSGYSAHHQIVLPYDGLFEFQVGSRAPLLDATRTLFVAGGRDFADRHPASGIGHSAIIINPAPAVLEELIGCDDDARCAFDKMSEPATPRLRLITHRLRALGQRRAAPLESDDLVLAAMREALRRTELPAVPPRLVARAKEYLHAAALQPVTLNEVAQAVGASPVYLSQAFTRAEGVPLYRYHLHLRVAHAIRALDLCDDITRLALDTGFSSHSHFSATFKTLFGITPSAVRSLLNKGAAKPNLTFRQALDSAGSDTVDGRLALRALACHQHPGA